MLVVLEGLEGAGKTTLCGLLQRDSQLAVIKTPPADLNAVRSIFEGDAPKESKFYFYLSGLYLVQPELDRLLGAGKTVVVDRYLLSTIAYHAAGQSFSPPKFESSKLEAPDLTINITCQEKIRLERLARRGKHIFDRGLVDDAKIAEFFQEQSQVTVDNSSEIGIALQRVREAIQEARTS